VEAIPAQVIAPRRAPRGRWIVAAVALLVLASPARAPATVVAAKDFAALCREADLIFVGTVTTVDSRWADPDEQSIETLVTFGNLTWLRGPAQPTVTLRFAGGAVDGLREAIAGVPQFAVGERRVIFAREGMYVSPIVGFDEQGALRVTEGPDGAQVVAPPTSGAALRLGTPSATPAAGPVPLDEYLDRIRARLGDPAAEVP
jgi:hypothetical protein